MGLADLVEEPWVANCASADHESGGPGVGQYLGGFGGGIDIAVGEHGAGQGVDGARDKVVMDAAAIALFYGAAVHGKKICLLYTSDAADE